MENTIQVSNIGPIKKLSIPLPEGGGVIVMKGRNGAGKTTALRSAAALLAGEGKLAKRDGAEGGQVEGFGATIKVKGSTRRTGELEVESLEGRLSLADIVEPGIDNPLSADKHRINGICQLAGVTLAPESFAGIFSDPDEFKELGIPEAIGTASDPVEMASRIKRRLQELAREAENDASKHAARSQELHRQAASVTDPDVETDEAKLQKALEEAIRWEGETIRAVEQTAAKNEAAEKAQALIVAAKDEWRIDNEEWNDNAPGVIRAKLTAAEGLTAEARKKVEAADRELVNAIQREGLVRANWDAANAMAKRLEALYLAADHGQNPLPAAELPKAQERVAAAREALRLGMVARAAQQAKVDAKDAENDMEVAGEAAKAYRGYAASVDGVLSGAVSALGGPLRVEEGRLVCDTDRCEGEPFADLSPGKRWKLAIDLAADASPEGAIFTLPQEAFEALDPVNRNLIACHARERGIVILTAEATEGDLRAEVCE